MAGLFTVMFFCILKYMKSTDYYLNLIYRKNRNRVNQFLAIPVKQRVAVFLSLRKHVKFQILRALPRQNAIELLESMDPDDATDAIQLLDRPTQAEIIKQLSAKRKDELEILLSFDEHTAGGLMSLDYIIVNNKNNISQVSKKFKEHEKRSGKAPEIIVVEEGRIAGYLPGYELGFSKPGDLIKGHIKKLTTIHHGATHAQVLEAFRRHPHNKLIVLDDKQNPLGIIYSDDVIKILKEQEGATLYDFAGVKEDEEVTDSANLKIKFRYKWLIINLATAFLAAFTVGLFDETISKYVLLAVYMPIVAGMGGNAGTQTLAVMVRGIALKQIDSTNFLRPLTQELIAGFVNGLINGLLVFAIVAIWSHNILMATILLVAMIVNLLVAAFFGTIIPVIMKSLGKDPASSATIFITTATDVLGFLTFLGLATILLK